MIEQLKGQMSIVDCFGPDIWSGKTCPEPLAQTKAKTSEPSSKKQRKSSVKMPLFLDLRGASGAQAAASWVMGGVLLGAYTMHSFGDSPSEENVSLLSQILEENPLPKYSLSARACAGILRRAEKRGKKLPELLEETLKRQSAFKSEPDAMGGARESSYNMNASEPCQPSTTNQCLSEEDKEQIEEFVKAANTGTKHQQDLIQSDLGISRTLAPGTHASGSHLTKTLITKCLNGWDVQSKHIQPQEGKAEALYSGECRGGGGESYVMQDRVYGISAYESNAMKSANPNSGIYEAETARTLDNNGGNPACNQGGMIVLEGNGSRDSHRGDGYKESEISYSLNTVEQHAVCVGNGQTAQTRISDKVGALNCMHDQQAVMTYGLDRASFNQGQNALYDFSVEEEKAQTIVAKGPGGY